MSFEEAHDALSKVAKAQNCTASELERCVSRHTLPKTTSFANLEAIHAAATGTCFVGTSASEMAISAHFEGVEIALPPAKKRRREERTERVTDARKQLAKSMPDLPSAELDVAELVLLRLVNQLRGSEGEICVYSFAVLGKKLSSTDPRPRVVIAARLHAGVAMSVEVLKEVLGTCWSDGILTTLATLHGISEIDLPYSAEAQAALSYGNTPLLLVTSVPLR